MIDTLLQSWLLRKLSNVDVSEQRFLAFLDYAYMPYALGDTLTWLANAQVLACEAGINEMDIVVLASRERPALSSQQFVTPYNFTANVYGLIPAFMSSPMVRNVHLLENRQTFYSMVTTALGRGRPMWPGISALIEEEIDFITHSKIVDHYKRNGSIPLLAAPHGYASQVTHFISTYCPDCFTIVVNVRQSHLKTGRSHPERDSRFEPWAEFIVRTAKRYPEVAFIIVGQYSDVDRRFDQLPSTIVPRSKGFGLGVELALLQNANLFMGTSSGFAQAALFGRPAYIVTNTEPRAAPFFVMTSGERHHPFGRPDQVVTWSPETVDSLEEDLRQVFAIKAKQGSRVPVGFA